MKNLLLAVTIVGVANQRSLGCNARFPVGEHPQTNFESPRFHGIGDTIQNERSRLYITGEPTDFNNDERRSAHLDYQGDEVFPGHGYYNLGVRGGSHEGRGLTPSTVEHGLAFGSNIGHGLAHESNIEHGLVTASGVDQWRPASPINSGRTWPAADRSVGQELTSHTASGIGQVNRIQNNNHYHSNGGTGNTLNSRIEDHQIAQPAPTKSISFQIQ